MKLTGDFWRLASALITLVASVACGSDGGPPTRIVGGTADTVIVNHRRAVRIPVRVLDAKGRKLPDSAVRYQWVGGSKVLFSSNGVITCVHSNDANIRASLGSISATILVRCRPVKKIQIAGPIQFLLPDSAQEMQMSVIDLDGKEVNLLAGTSDIMDTTVATIDGVRVIPRSPGSTVAGVRFGNQSAGVGVHVYERASTLDGLRHGKQFIGIPLRMSGTQVQTWDLPPGTWMLTMLPEDAESTGLRMRIEGANCSEAQLTRRRYVCLVKRDATVTVYHPSTSHSALQLTGELLVRMIN